MKKTHLLALTFVIAASALADPLPSWNDTDAKEEIIAFVDKVTTPGSPDFVPEAERVAVFDNDGTLWSEQPVYFQLLFIFDRIQQMAPEHPEWAEKEPFASVIKGDYKQALAGGHKAILSLAMAAQGNITAKEMKQATRDWIGRARHPATGRKYTEMVYQPMLELLDYLQANGFTTYIVSGGGIDFMRVFSEQVYGIPPEQVVGTSMKARYEVRDGEPVIVKEPALDFIDDKAGKPVGIYQHIGRRPIFAAGNSDGDFEMLEWTTAGDGPRFGMLVHHTDAEREWAYDRDSHVGSLNRGLSEAEQRGWLLVDMKGDWTTVYPEQTD